MASALGLCLDVDHAGVCKFLETLCQHRARYKWRGVEQFAESPRPKAELPHDDRGPTVAEDFGCFGYRTELGVADHGASSAHPDSEASTFYVLACGLTDVRIERSIQRSDIMRSSPRVVSTGLPLSIVL